MFSNVLEKVFPSNFLYPASKLEKKNNLSFFATRVFCRPSCINRVKECVSFFPCQGLASLQWPLFENDENFFRGKIKSLKISEIRFSLRWACRGKM